MEKDQKSSPLSTKNFTSKHAWMTLAVVLAIVLGVFGWLLIKQSEDLNQAKTKANQLANNSNVEVEAEDTKQNETEKSKTTPAETSNASYSTEGLDRGNFKLDLPSSYGIVIKQDGAAGNTAVDLVVAKRISNGLYRSDNSADLVVKANQSYPGYSDFKSWKNDFTNGEELSSEQITIDGTSATKYTVAGESSFTVIVFEKDNVYYAIVDKTSSSVEPKLETVIDGFSFD